MKRLAWIGVVTLVAAGCSDDTAGGGQDMAAASGDMSAVADGGGGDAAASDGGGDGGGGNATAARGEYLVKALLACGDCHTTPDQMGNPSMNPADFLAGGRAFPVGPNMTVYTKNLTPDMTNGIGKWTVAQIKNAIQNGIDDEGKPLFPVMPYYQYHNLTDDDATSIALFLKTLPPNANKVPDDTASVQGPAPPVDDKMVPHTTLPSTDASYASAEHGRYLAENVCLECHTKHNPPGPGAVLDLSKAYAGGETFPLGPGLTTISANITPDATGIKDWTVDEIAATLKTDKEKGVGRMLCPPMPGGAAAFANLTDADRSDIANYVHTLPPIQNGPFGCDDAGVPYGLPDGGM